MPTAYTPVAANATNTIPVTANGDSKDAASVATPMQRLADRAEVLTTRVAYVPFRPDTWLKSGTRTSATLPTSSEAYEAFDGDHDSGGTRWTMKAPGGMVINKVSTAGGAGAWSFNMSLPRQYLSHKKTLSSVRVPLIDAAAHAGLPQQMPAIVLYRFQWSSSNPALAMLTSGGFTLDTSANTTAYQAEHEIVYTPNQNNVIDCDTYGYGLCFISEGGTNALVGLAVGPLKFTFID